MEETKQVRVRLSAVTTEFLEEYRERERLSDRSNHRSHHPRLSRDDQKAMGLELCQSFRLETDRARIDVFWDEQISKSLAPLRKSVQQTDLQTQVLIELVQALMQTESIEDIIPTTEYRPSFLETAETAVKQRIDQRKQHKHSDEERMTHK